MRQSAAFMFWLGLALGRNAVADKVEKLIEQYDWNAKLMESLDEDYEIVYPFRVHDKVRTGIETTNYFYANQTVHHEEVSFVVRSSFGRFRLNVRRNDNLLPAGAPLQDARARRAAPENCYYQGSVHKRPSSSVALSTCFGIRALIVDANETWVLTALRGGDLGRRHPHALFRARWRRRAACANGDQTDWSTASLLRRRHQRHRRDVDRETKFVELALVADNHLANEFPSQFDAELRFVLEVVNIVDMMYTRDLNTRVSLVHFESWSLKSHIYIDPDITQSLLNFLDYVTKELYTKQKDAAILLTTSHFLRREVVDLYQPHRAAAVLAHSLGHILGMAHDDAEDVHCECANGGDCLMRNAIGNRKLSYARSFSQCSKDDMLTTLSLGRGRCLFNLPLKVSVRQRCEDEAGALQADELRHCGNGRVDDGEECDCGGIDACARADPCCDAVTCKRKAFAACAAGPCCDQCQVLGVEWASAKGPLQPKAAGTVCRAATSTCDVTERCDGHSGVCPADGRLIDGADCADDGDAAAHCYHGECVSRDRQCRQLWGVAARSSADSCFERFNVLGVDHGHCGAAESGYKQCPSESVLCGLLHCEGGADSVHVGPATTYKTAVESGGGATLECKVVAAAMVADGAVCGASRVCVGGVCEPFEAPVVRCPTNNLALACSGHGACTTTGACHCDGGWARDDCSELVAPVFAVGNGAVSARPPSSADGHSLAFDISFDDLDTVGMLAILGIVAIFVLLFLLCLLFCYRRRTPSSTRKKKQADIIRAQFERYSESSIETATNRSIKFGNMPSYRTEKHKRKMQRLRDLHRINEASDERDSVSNKSRESGERSAISGLAYGATVVCQGAATQTLPPPERGILKNGTPRTSDSEARSPLLARPTARHASGYESEPAEYAAYRVFGNSARRLDRCDAGYYGVPPTEAIDPAAGSAYAAAAGRSRSRQHHRQPFNTATGYATDTEVTYAAYGQRRLAPHSEQLARRCDAPYEAQTFDAASTSDRLSPANSVASSRGLGLPQPLKLRNIEFLLKQLDGRESPVTSAAGDCDARRTADDDDELLEESSHTESHRDAAQLAADMADMADLAAADDSPVDQLGGHHCTLEQYNSFTMQSFTCSNASRQIASESHTPRSRPNQLGQWKSHFPD